MLVGLLAIVSGLTLENIPSSRTPPRSTIASASVYDPLENRIISIGGLDSVTSDQSPNIYSFSLDSMEFEKIFKLSDYEPKAYSGHRMYLRNDRKIIVFGFSSGIASFNLVDLAWTQERLTGDYILDLSNPAFTSFIYNNIQYVALYGGVSETGIKNDLYL